MELIFTLSGIVGSIVHVLVFIYFASALPLGPLSLPCIAVLTSFLYFYFMPVTAVMAGNNYLFGMQLNSLDATHWIAALYVLGIALACGLNEKRLRILPSPADETPARLNRFIFFGL